MAQQFRSTVWVFMCFLASNLVAVMAEGKTSAQEGADPQHVQATITNAWTATSGFAATASEKLSNLVESQPSLVPMFGVGAAVALTVACTLYCTYLYLDPEPYLFNNGKLGPLESKSIYVNKKCC